MSTTGNGAIQSVVLTKGNFNIVRDTTSKMKYSYKGYAGISPWGTPSTDSGNTFGTVETDGLDGIEQQQLQEVLWEFKN